MHTGLRFDQQLAGIIALSTYLSLADSLETEKSIDNQGTAIFMAHGVDDPMIPIELARRSRDQPLLCKKENKMALHEQRLNLNEEASFGMLLSYYTNMMQSICSLMNR